jgi:hypothetical protein
MEELLEYACIVGILDKRNKPEQASAQIHWDGHFLCLNSTKH